jgi:hypothetical protein
MTMVIECETFSLYPVQNKRANGCWVRTGYVQKLINLKELPALKEETNK